MASKNPLDTKIEFLKGVGPKRAETLNKELSVFTFKDLLMHFPFRYVDKTKFHKIRDLSGADQAVQLRGILRRIDSFGSGRRRRLTGKFRDDTGSIELVWFQHVTWLEKSLQVGSEYIIYGRISSFKGKKSIVHPEMELVSDGAAKKSPNLDPVYSTTGKLDGKGLDTKGLRKIQLVLHNKLKDIPIEETLPNYFLEKLRLPTRSKALRDIHFPGDRMALQEASKRLKFEELFFLQLRILRTRNNRKKALKGHVFATVGTQFNTFFSEKLPFELTNAQKRVLKEIRADLRDGKHMNRLLQGDVGSGKTIVALMTMLIALDNNFQASLMAPTEILAQQHYQSLTEMVKGMGINIGFLSGSVKGKKRKTLLALLEQGDIHILVGTHALIEDWVVFKNLGISIIDEQHRFGVAQRASLWKKGGKHPETDEILPPHVLVMTATPIPRTLSMTLYGDLDISIIDELPPGRKEIITLHKTENNRLRVFGFMKEQIALGRQIYVVYPLIEESEAEALEDLNNLMAGYESISREFPKPEFQISVVHGRMKAADKDYEMQRFVKGETQIMVATTVIEVGVNVPNATVMIIENTERFGLSQLHQLRGRVGRGGDQSYCILMSSFKLTKDGKTRIETMVRTNNGFEIAEVDMKLRGPGNIEGTQQSGLLQFKIADLVKDAQVLSTARELAARVLEDDPDLKKPHHNPLRRFLEASGHLRMSWSMIS
ncbi:MAG: ATP-dependent DNA helicase RecG [Bacteroidota bacterium]